MKLTYKHLASFLVASIVGLLVGTEINPVIGVIAFFVAIPMTFNALTPPVQTKWANLLVSMLFFGTGYLSVIGILNVAHKSSAGLLSTGAACLSILVIGGLGFVCIGGFITFFTWFLGYPKSRKE